MIFNILSLTKPVAEYFTDPLDSIDTPHESIFQAFSPNPVIQAVTPIVDEETTPLVPFKNSGNKAGASSFAIPSAFNSNNILTWTSQDPRDSVLFNSSGIHYRFQVCLIAFAVQAIELKPLLQTTLSHKGSITTMWRAVQLNKENRCAMLQWASNGGLGRVVMGKVCNFSRLLSSMTFAPHCPQQNSLRMTDLARPDSSLYVCIPCDHRLISPCF